MTSVFQDIQERGIKALEFGLNVDIKGYNLYLEGPSGVGKTMYTKKYLDTISKKKKIPTDWCYIYNFDNPNEPIAVSLSAGHGKEFKEKIDWFECEWKWVRSNTEYQTIPSEKNLLALVEKNIRK